MRKILKKSLVLVLALSMLLLAPMQASALTLQEQSYLSHLWPKTMPKSSTSYPAKLIMDVFIPDMEGRLEFMGSIGTSAALSDEEMLALLQQALSGQSGNKTLQGQTMSGQSGYNTLQVQVLSGQSGYRTLQAQAPSGQSGYRTLQDVVDEKTRIRELTEKLSFTQEDMDAIAANLRQMLGVDELWDVVNGELPGYGADDALDMALSAAQGENPLNPKPGLSGIFISTLFVTWEEMQKDKEKYQDIIALSQANERLRNFYSAFNKGYRAFLVENGDWTLKINAQDVADLTYNQVPGNKQLWTADIDLKKSDGGFDSITGTYSGAFKLSMDADMSAYDDGYDDFLAASFLGLPYSPVGNSGAPSEITLAYEIPNCQLNISLPPGINRHFFEEIIPSDSLTQTAFTIKSDRTVEIRWDKGSGAWHSIVQQFIEDNGVMVSSQIVTEYSPVVGPTSVTNHDSDNVPWPPDTRPYITLTLVIDMLSN